MKFLVIVLLSSVLLARLSLAATFYVATNGDDSNSCMQAQDPSTPKRNIMALSCQMINFIGLDTIKKLDQIGRVGDVAEVKKKPHTVDVRVLIEMIDPFGVECRGATYDAVNLIPFFQE